MSVYQKLEDGLLAPGLFLFGSNAYLNAPYIATPYSGALSRSKDAYNFYHLQSQIQIECAFGDFSQLWCILWSVLPKRATVKKVVALVLAPAKLRNFCMVEKQSIENQTANGINNIE